MTLADWVKIPVGRRERCATTGSMRADGSLMAEAIHAAVQKLSRVAFVGEVAAWLRVRAGHCHFYSLSASLKASV